MKKLILLGLMSAFADCSATDAMRKFERLDSSLLERLPLQCQSGEALAVTMDILQNSSANQKSEPILEVAIPQAPGLRQFFECLSKAEESHLPIRLVGISDSMGLLSGSWSAVLGEDNFKILKARTVSVDSSTTLEDVPAEYFAGWKQLVHVTISGPILKTIGASAFAGTGLREIHIPDSVQELCDKCFFKCKSLSRVTFGESSSLKLIGKEAFYCSGLREIHIPDSVEELCEACFYWCESLSCVIFGENSSFKLIGKRAFAGTGIREIHIPDRVEELCKECFYLCRYLSRVTFGESSNLKLIGKKAFYRSGLREIHIPDSVEELCKACFSGGDIPDKRCPQVADDTCGSLSRVTFGDASSLKRIGKWAFYQNSITAICIPDSVEELCSHCFKGCKSLSRVTFGVNSSLKRIGRAAFCCTGICEIYIPDGVEELGDACFLNSQSLSRVTFGEASSLKLIGEHAFCCTGICEIYIPDGVEELGKSCFSCCQALSRVIFGEASSLKRIGGYAFCKSGIREIHILDSVEELGESCFWMCKLLSRVTFGEAPSLKLIGKKAFCESGLSEIHLPNSLREIYDNAFANTNLPNVNVGESTIWSIVDALPYGAGYGYRYAIVWTLKSTDEGNRWVTTNITDDRSKKLPIPPQIMQLADQAHND